MSKSTYVLILGLFKRKDSWEVRRNGGVRQAETTWPMIIKSIIKKMEVSEQVEAVSKKKAFGADFGRRST
jgi:hypothetical protein